MYSEDEYDLDEDLQLDDEEFVAPSSYVPNRVSFRELGVTAQLGVVTAYLNRAAHYFFIQPSEVLSSSGALSSCGPSEGPQGRATANGNPNATLPPIGGKYVSSRFHRQRDEYRPLSLRDLGSAIDIAEQVANLLVNAACVAPSMRTSWEFHTNDGMNLQFATLIAAAVQHVVWVAYRVVVSRWVLKRWFLAAAKRGKRSDGHAHTTAATRSGVHRLGFHWIHMRHYLFECLRKRFPGDPLALTVSPATSWHDPNQGPEETLGVWFSGLSRERTGGYDSDLFAQDILQWIGQHPIRRVLYEIASYCGVVARNTATWWLTLYRRSVELAGRVMQMALNCKMIPSFNGDNNRNESEATKMESEALRCFVHCIFSARVEEVALAALLIAVRTSPDGDGQALAAPDVLPLLEDSLAPVVQIGLKGALSGMQALFAWSWWGTRPPCSAKTTTTGMTTRVEGGKPVSKRMREEVEPLGCGAATDGSAAAMTHCSTAVEHLAPLSKRLPSSQSSKDAAHPSAAHRRSSVTCEICGIVLTKQRFPIHYRTHAALIANRVQHAAAVMGTQKTNHRQTECLGSCTRNSNGAAAVAMGANSHFEEPNGIVVDCVPRELMMHHPSVLFDPAAATLGVGVSPRQLLQQCHYASTLLPLQSTMPQQTEGSAAALSYSDFDGQWSAFSLDPSQDGFYEPLMLEVVSPPS